MTGNRSKQNEFVVRLQNCITAYENADKLFDEIDDFIQNKMPEETRIFDKEQQDVLHIFEQYDLTDSQIVKLGRHFMKTRENRRNWHNIFEIARVWESNKNKIFNRNNRIFLREALGKRIKDLDKDWNFKILSEEEVKELLEEDYKEEKPQLKRGKPSIPQNKVDKCLELLNNGSKPKDIAHILKIGLTTVYKIKKENR